MKDSKDKKVAEEIKEEISVNHTEDFSENELEKAREKEKDNNIEEEIKKEDSEEKVLFKIEQRKPKKIKIFDVLLILVVLVIFGTLSFFLVNKVFLNESKSSILYYKLTFDSNGGSSVPPIEARRGYVELPTNIYKEGYRFAGWAVGDVIVNGKYYVESSTSFKAQWRANEVVPESDDIIYYSVVFDFNGAGNIYVKQVLSGEKVEKPENPTLNGYTFKGWYNGDSIYNFDTKIMSDIRLIAQWEKKENNVVYRTVSFNLNGGGRNYTKKVISGEKISEPEDPVRDGYIFKGWTCDGKSYDFNKTIKTDITLVAQWEKEKVTTYNVTFEKNNGESSLKQTVASGNKISKPSNPVKKGYNFAGWYLKNNTQYNFSNAITSNVVLYAKWVPNLNVKNNFFFDTTPKVINSTSLLADDEYGKNLLNKTGFNGTAEIYYTHEVSGTLNKNILYAIRVFNNSKNRETIKINKCGAVTGNDVSEIWKQYYSDGCDVAGQTYTVEPYKCLIIMHNGNSFVVRDVNDQSGVAMLNGSFEGVLNITTSNHVYVAAIAFKNIGNTYNAVYKE